MDFEEYIAERIVKQFFEPTTRLVPSFSWTDETGRMRTEWVQGNDRSPMQIVAEELFTWQRGVIMAEIQARISVEDIIEKVVPLAVAQIVAQFDTKQDTRYSSPGESARRKMEEAVWKRVADEFGKRAVEFLQQTGGLRPVLGSVVESSVENS